MKVLTYVYYKWEMTTPMGIIGTNPDRYMKNLRRIVDGGYFDHVTYAGQLNCTCGGTEEFGGHYGFIIQADKEMTRKILNVIEYDISESFDEETWEKLDRDFETMDERIEELVL